MEMEQDEISLKELFLILWQDDLVRITNDYLRDKAIEESERHISYLNEQAANTDIAQVRSGYRTANAVQRHAAILKAIIGRYETKIGSYLLE